MLRKRQIDKPPLWVAVGAIYQNAQPIDKLPVIEGQEDATSRAAYLCRRAADELDGRVE